MNSLYIVYTHIHTLRRKMEIKYANTEQLTKICKLLNKNQGHVKIKPETEIEDRKQYKHIDMHTINK